MPFTVPVPPLPTPRELVLWAEQRFTTAGLVFGHGTDNARDEAVFLVFHALGLAFDCEEAVLDRPCDAAGVAAATALVDERIHSRRPAAYLAGRMWFAGLEFMVDERVLVPRSPIAEIVERGFAPWIDPGTVRRVLDIGTGSACIAVAAALALPRARVDATDVSADALAVARINVARHGVGDRVRIWQADLFPPAPRVRYDVIVSNPPYVRDVEVAAFPPEYRHEPVLGLAAGADGLDCVRRILAGAARRLSAHGILVVEIGGEAGTIERAFPRLPFIWVEFARGGEGVFVLRRQDLEPLPGPAGRHRRRR
ncbi:MAG: 50S ribosomal protein L3 N(5)-glutamine methyltransferase [Gammaproteobacteria bacterium]|nr:50S ribosomal protein L3 N(5)-glutamine methyltransferase [Gammaproteobacteria bacterium]